MKIKPRERNALIQSLRAGVVPRTGQHLIQVGRDQEVRALLTDIDRIADGKVVEWWRNDDFVWLLHQLGRDLIPAG